MKLTKSFVDRLELSKTGKVEFYWDSEVKGYGVKVSETKKVYIVQTKIKGSTVRLTIGTHGAITEAQARDLSKKELFRIADGVDPRNEKKKQKILEMTLSDVSCGEVLVFCTDNEPGSENVVDMSYCQIWCMTSSSFLIKMILNFIAIFKNNTCNDISKQAIAF